ncbi:hypothetical protein COLO4_35038, partial [Corchorus olitorius]
MLSLLKAYHNFLLLALFFLSFEANLPSSSSSPTHLCSQTEATALIQFKTSFSIDSVASSYCDDEIAGIKSYAKTESWKEGTDCCSWDGVSCDEKKGQVIGLDLSCSWLYGTFSSNSTLFHLQHLRELNLAFNYFNHSKMPSKFGGFPNLVYLNLSSSFFGGQVPLEVSHLSKLVSLDLSRNFYEPIDKVTFERLVGNQTELRDLSLDGINMSSVTPNALMNLSSSLRSLSLEDCDLRGNFPDEVNAFPNLISLRLSSNLLNGTLPSWLFTAPSSLRSIDLSYNQFSGQIKEFQSKSLEFLSLENNKLQGPILSSISQQLNLVYLRLSYNNLSGVVEYEMFSKLQNLTILDLSYNRDLSLINSNPSSADYTLPNLRYLGLASCKVTEFPPFLKASKGLESLDLSNNRIQGKIPKWMWDVGKDSLTYLNLSHNSLTQVEHLPWTGIETLDLSSNVIHGDLPIPPYGTSVFFISNNSLSGEISSLICNVTSLENLDLSHNNLSGVVPHCLGDLSSSLLMLNLGVNKLYGIIPPIFAEYCRLSFLDLNGNQLEGPLPRSIHNCRQLQVLDLGNNKIN